MGRRGAIFFVTMLGLVGAAGCSRVDTYTVEQERVDQDLVTGNQGYLAGPPKEDPSLTNRRTTRTTYVAEIEVGAPYKRSRRSLSLTPAQEAVQEPGASQPSAQEAAGTAAPPSPGTPVTEYTVAANDTLEKIAGKVYGDPAKWNKIFEANADRLKSPDRIYPGQVLAIPQE
jgi:nucleoid-associated protein YgaU